MPAITRAILRAIAIGLALALSLAATPASSIAADASSMRTIEVNGNGESRSAPDIAHLSLDIETHAQTAEDCSTKNAALAQKVVDALKAKLAGKGVISTGGYSLTPEYKQPRPGEPYVGKPEIIGYTAQNTITVETDELSRLGSLLDGAVAAGANRVNYVNFGVRDDTKARAEAISNASKDAQAQAQALAASLGVKLRRIVKAAPMVPPRPIPFEARSMAMASSANAAVTPVEPGQITVTATVSLTYEIE